MENNKVTSQQTYTVISKRPLPELQPNDPVRIHNNSLWRLKGNIVKKLTSPDHTLYLLREELLLGEIGKIYY